MSKKSRARAAASAATSAEASTAPYPSPPPEPNTHTAHWGTFLAAGIIVLAALVAYHNSFSGPFTFDDRFAIADNPSIRQLGSALSPPPYATTGGRPLLNLTFALNYAVGGMDVWGYHAFNLLIHMLAGLTLFGIVRRTLLRPAFAGLRSAGFVAIDRGAISQGQSLAEALPLALVVALIWVVHPLQTEAVTYVSQRAESLMGLFYLLTLYGFIRSVESPTPARWQVLSFLACLLGTMTKEIIVTAPAMVLLYDRTFVAGSFCEAWRLRWRYYLGLAATWLLLARLMTSLNQRSVGFDQGVTCWNYALTSCRSVVLYLKLAVWPHPLLFDYGTNVVQHAPVIVPFALIVAVLIAGTAIALWRWPVIGFAGAWFFTILAPTSSVIPIAYQPMAENRMYLPLIAMVGLVVLGLHRLIGRRSLIICVTAAVGLGWLTIRRNEDYRSDLALWSDTAVKCPENERAHYNLGNALKKIPNHTSEAILEYEAALQIKPDDVEAHDVTSLF